MSGGKQKSKSNTSTRQTLAPWSQNQWQTHADQVRGGIDAFRDGIAGYDGPLIAGMSDAEKRAGGLIDEYQGSWEGALSEMRGMLGEDQFSPMAPRSFADFDADVYVNPYADEMISGVTGDLEEAAARARTSATADTLTNGAYGGSRHGVRESAIDQNMLDSIADASSGIRFNTWDRGADRFYQDVGNDMQATQYNDGVQFARTQGMGALLDAERGYQNEDITRLLDFGGLERGIEDRGYAANYADFIRKRQEEQAALGLDFGLLGSIPMLVNSTGESSSVQSSNPGALGIAGTLLSGGSAMFGGDGLWAPGGIFAPK